MASYTFIFFLVLIFQLRLSNFSALLSQLQKAMNNHIDFSKEKTRTAFQQRLQYFSCTVVVSPIISPLSSISLSLTVVSNYKSFSAAELQGLKENRLQPGSPISALAINIWRCRCQLHHALKDREARLELGEEKQAKLGQFLLQGVKNQAVEPTHVNNISKASLYIKCQTLQSFGKIGNFQ